MGEVLSHSMEEAAALELNQPRLVESPSQIIHINIIIEAKEMIDPIEEITFQVVKASG